MSNASSSTITMTNRGEAAVRGAESVGVERVAVGLPR